MGIRLLNSVRHYGSSEGSLEDIEGTSSVPLLVTPMDSNSPSDTDSIFDGSENEDGIFPQIMYRTLEGEVLMEQQLSFHNTGRGRLIQSCLECGRRERFENWVPGVEWLNENYYSDDVGQSNITRPRLH